MAIRKRRGPQGPDGEGAAGEGAGDMLGFDNGADQQAGPGFMPGDGGGFNPDIGGMNRVDHLPDPPQLGGQPKTQELFGQQAEPVMGRPSSPRLFAQASLFPTCAQLRVFKVDNGVPTGLGVIAPDATEEDLVTTFYSAINSTSRTQFRIRPIDINNEELGQEFPIYISEHHATVRAIREAQALQAQNPSVQFQQVGSALNDHAVRLLEKMADAAEERAKAVERTLEHDRERVREQERQMAQERVDLASQAALGVKSISERMMEDEARRAQRAMEAQGQQSNMLLTTITSIFAQQSQQQQAWAEQQRMAQDRYAQQQQQLLEHRLEQERIRAEREAREAEDRRRREAAELAERLRHERETAAQTIARERAELDTRLAREREERQERESRERRESEERAKEREAERQRQHELRMLELKEQAQRDREHAERMAALKQAEAGATGGSLKTMLVEGLGIAKMLGFGADDIKGFFRPEREEPEDNGAGVVRTMEALAPVAAIFGEVLKEGLRSRRENQLIQAGIVQQPGIGMMPVPPQIAQQQMQQVAPALVNPQQVPVSEADEQAEASGKADPVDQLPLATQKSARVALRALVRKLATTPEDSWIAETAAAVQAEGAIFHFVKAAGLRRALHEANATPEMAQKLLQKAQESGIVPTDMLENP